MYFKKNVKISDPFVMNIKYVRLLSAVEFKYLFEAEILISILIFHF